MSPGEIPYLSDITRQTLSYNNSESVFAYCSSSTKLNEKTLKRLRKILSTYPSLVRARSFGLGLLCPDSLTPLMACAVSGQIVAANVILDIAARPNKFRSKVHPEMEYLHLDRNMFGRAALSLAAEAGNVDMVDLLLTLQKSPGEGETPTVLTCLPIDLQGRTPYGCGMASPTPKARLHRKKLEERLFSLTDSSIRGAYHPAHSRSCNIPYLQIAYGTAEMPGKRIIMEDSMCQDHWYDENYGKEFLLFGVCDGHGDDGLVSDFVASNMANLLKETMKEMSDEGVEVSMFCVEDWNTIWRKTCLAVDAELKKKKLDGGSTGVFALVSSDFIVVANVGDSRCVLVQKEGTASLVSTVTPLSFDHKPEDPAEKDRVIKAGMTVEKQMYVIDGVERTFTKIVKSQSDKLAVARAFGDFDYKQNDKLGPEDQAVCCLPEVVVHKRDEKESFLVLACDGVWDVMSNEDVKDFVVEQVREKMKTGEVDALLPEVGDALLGKCLKRGSTDNMSAMLVCLQPKSGQVLSASDNK